jgi:hypothetical protein
VILVVIALLAIRLIDSHAMSKQAGPPPLQPASGGAP